MGEGAGILVLEELGARAEARRQIYAEMVGYGMWGERSMSARRRKMETEPSARCATRFRAPSTTTEEIDYINAHGTSTPLGDEIELGAVKRLFGGAFL